MSSESKKPDPMDQLHQETGRWLLTHHEDAPKIGKILTSTVLVQALLDHLGGGALLSDFLQTVDLGDDQVGAGTASDVQ